MTSREEIARSAGVSVRTVANVISGVVNVAPETRSRVVKAMDEAAYQPSEIGRMLRTGRSGMIGLVLPELDTPYFAELSRAIVVAAGRRGYTVIIDQSDGQIERERELLDRADRRALFEGLIISPLALKATDLERAPSTRPVVLLGETEYPGYDLVCIDSRAAAREATEHLIARGRRDIIAIGREDSDRSTSRLRYQGYAEAMMAAGLQPRARNIPPAAAGSGSAFTRRAGAMATAALLDSQTDCDALFCFSDLLAIGALRVLHEQGVLVPDDVAVVGFDNIEEGQFSWPSLTTIAPDKSAIASLAVDALVARIEGDGRPLRGDQPRFRLVERESSAV